MQVNHGTRLVASLGSGELTDNIIKTGTSRCGCAVSILFAPPRRQLRGCSSRRYRDSGHGNEDVASGSFRKSHSLRCDQPGERDGRMTIVASLHTKNVATSICCCRNSYSSPQYRPLPDRSPFETCRRELNGRAKRVQVCIRPVANGESSRHETPTSTILKIMHAF